jgi:lipoprotein-releasing system permease protein
MYGLILATRYFLRRRMAYAAAAAVAVCVFMVVVVMTVMTGLVGDFKDKNHRWTGDCVISTPSMVGFDGYERFVGILEGADFVRAAAAVINGYALLGYPGSDYTEAVEVVGIDPGGYCAVTNFGQSLHYHTGGCRGAFEPLYAPYLPGCVVGIDKVLSRDEYGSYAHPVESPKYSFTLTGFPLTASGRLARAGLDVVISKVFHYSDDFHSGLAKEDGSAVYIDFGEAQALFGMDSPPARASAIHVAFEPHADLEAACEGVRQLWESFSSRDASGLLGRVRVESWKDYRREVIAAVEKEQAMMVACFVMIGIITVFIVFVIFYMLVSHKTRDIGTLRSVGAGGTEIIRMFMGFSLMVGACGSIAGTAGAAFFLARINVIEQWLFRRYGFQLWNRMVYAIDEIPSGMTVRTVAVVATAAVAACLAGALLPSWWASRADPVRSLRASGL